MNPDDILVAIQPYHAKLAALSTPVHPAVRPRVLPRTGTTLQRVTGRPVFSQEPMRRIKASFYGDGGQGKPSWPGQGWVVLTWTAERPDAVLIWGPFRTLSEGRAFGRKRAPRRYQVAGMHDPNGQVRMYGHSYPDREE